MLELFLFKWDKIVEIEKESAFYIRPEHLITNTHEAAYLHEVDELNSQMSQNINNIEMHD